MGSPSLRQQLAIALPSQTQAHWLTPGAAPPKLNHLAVVDTYHRFEAEFLPQCPIVDPRGREIRLRSSNFPKFVKLTARAGVPHKKPTTIVESIVAGTFKEADYEWQKDRIQALFWVPDLLRDPDAIYIKTPSQGLIKAEEVYVKIYRRLGSPVKLVFVDYVGKHRDPIFITSFFTSLSTARKHCHGTPLYLRP